MNSGLASNADQPYGGKVALPQEEIEHPAVNWVKLIFLILLTYGLMVCMWEICSAMFVMKDHSVPASYESAGGLLFGLFCFYVLMFGLFWYFGSKKRDDLRRMVVEKEIARQKALEAMNQLE